MAKEIQLTRNLVAIVDDEDFERVNARSWYAKMIVSSKTVFYATSAEKLPSGKHTCILMHRFIMQPPEGKEVDHIDRNPLNNQKSNLRLATRAENSRNRKIYTNNTCGYQGVQFSKQRNRFFATLRLNGVRYRSTSRLTAIEAAADYNELAIKYHGEFACLNKIED